MNEIKRLFLSQNPDGEQLWSDIEILADGDAIAAVDRIQELAENDPSVNLPDWVLDEMSLLAIPEN